MDKRRLTAAVPLVALYVVNAVAGICAVKMGVPLPWMIGPLIATAAIFLLSGSGYVVTLRTRPVAQATIAIQVGMAFTPLALASVLAHGALMIIVTVMTLVMAACVSFTFARLAGVRFSSAMIATLPTSPVEAAVIAEAHGFSLPPVILAQTLRVALVVIVVPLAVLAIGEGSRQTAIPVASEGLVWLEYAILITLALAGRIVFRKLRISNPNFLGPLAASALCAGLGLAFSHVPPALMHLAQIILGTWLGANFRRDLFSRSPRLLLAAAASALLFIVLAMALGVVLAWLTGLNWKTMVLAAAPGGVTEMALTASALKEDVALVTGFHLTRIFLLVPLVPGLITLLHRRETRG